MDENKVPQQAEDNSAPETPNKEKKQIKIPFGLSGKLFSILCVLLAVIIALGSAFSVSMVKLYNSRRHGAVYDMDSELTLAEKGDMVPIWNPDFGYGAIPALEGVPVCTYKEENFRIRRIRRKAYLLLCGIGIRIKTVAGTPEQVRFHKCFEDGGMCALHIVGGKRKGPVFCCHGDSPFVRMMFS